MIQKARPIRNALFFHYYCCFVEWQEEECSSQDEQPLPQQSSLPMQKLR